MTDVNTSDFNRKNKSALEHAEYLAAHVESFLQYLNSVSNVQEGSIDPDEHFGERTQGLRNAVYEFRKRKERADSAIPKEHPDTALIDFLESNADVNRLYDKVSIDISLDDSVNYDSVRDLLTKASSQE